MRTERELLDIVYDRADALRRTRRSRAAGALAMVAVAIVGAGIVTSNIDDGGEAAVVAGPIVGDAPAGPAAGVQPPEAAGRLEIAAIGLDVDYAEGMSASQLEAGPGHYPNTPRPGHVGNSAIAGHRASHGAPFSRLDELTPGDRIVVTTSEGAYAYEVRETLTVEPSAVEVIGPEFWPDRWGDEAPATLTLTTEADTGSSGRLVVGAELVGETAQ